MNPHDVYKQASVATSPGKLVVMLYDGLLKFMDEAAGKIDQKDIEGAHKALLRAQDIVLELRSTLAIDEAPELGQNLYDLYSFMYGKLVDANRLKESVPIAEIRPVVTELRDAFAQAETELSVERQG